ncbi:MAG: hypothetical protein KDI01_00785, partial [Halioglobus sp.]|nr:hypothetical protein [Halioglobus sp.]
MAPYVYLSLALLLPWLDGYLWLAAAECRLHAGRGHTARQLGYGLFLGFAALQAVVLAYSHFLGAVAFWPIMAVMGLLALVGGALYLAPTGAGLQLDSPLPGAPQRAAPAQASRAQTVLFWLFATWAGVHLLFVAIEILHRPIFPWDAWLNWMYRAKAWYYSGHIFALDSPAQWLDGSGQTAYNVAGNHYPTFVPVLGLWAATALGRWSETLVNLPVLCCGIALGLALYGQCREYGLARWHSALCAYLLLSIPLVGAHLALAGQADIWMAGFTGLGFAALLHGMLRRRRSQVLLGLVMAALATGVKLEGGVWFAAALLTLGLATCTRSTLAALALLGTFAALGWAAGITYLELPVLGGLGIADGRVHVPLLGSYALQSFALWDDYRDNFFLVGTWHLLWLFLLLAAVSLVRLPAARLRRTLAVFYLVVLLAQLFIFQGTESGRWAEDWTAINRLPLHFSPALVFSLAILWRAFADRSADAPGAARIAAGAVLGLATTFAGAALFLYASYPAGDGQARHYSITNMRLVVGGGHSQGDIGVVDRYQNNIAILSSGPVSFEAAGLGLARIETAPGAYKRATFFWRNGTTARDLHSVDVPGQGSRWLSLGDLPAWRGHITEVGLMFYAEGDQVVRFHGLDLVPGSLGAHLDKLLRDWLHTSQWSQKSVNWLPAGAASTTLPLPALMGAWILVMALATVILAAAHRPGALATLLVSAIAAWA